MLRRGLGLRVWEVFLKPAECMSWYEREGPLRGTGAPVVGGLLYWKHVITDQPYIPQLIRWVTQEYSC